jgi:hypothetical protein
MFDFIGASCGKFSSKRGIFVKYAKRAKEILDIEIAGLRKVRDAIGDEFGRAIGLLLACLKDGHKIIVTGVGKNLPVGEKIGGFARERRAAR